MKRFALAACIAIGATLSLPAAAQFQKPEDAIKYRQSAFTLMATHFGRIAGMAQGRIPFDAKAAAENAEILSTVAKLPVNGFVPGSDKGAPTRAKPEIWTEGPKVKELNDKMLDAVAKLDAAAKAGNLDQIKAAVGAVGQSCKACHDSYRADR